MSYGKREQMKKGLTAKIITIGVANIHSIWDKVLENTKTSRRASNFNHNKVPSINASFTICSPGFLPNLFNQAFQ